MIGAGVYDKECTGVMVSTNAAGCILIVLGGDRGHGFSATFINPQMVKGLPEALREVADKIEADQENGIT